MCNIWTESTNIYLYFLILKLPKILGSRKSSIASS